MLKQHVSAKKPAIMGAGLLYRKGDSSCYTLIDHMQLCDMFVREKASVVSVLTVC